MTMDFNLVATKRCSKCGETKSAEEFHKDTSNRDGRKYECRSCYNRARRERRWTNPERSREIERKKSKKWRADNPEKSRARVSEWRLKNPGKNAEMARDWRKRNPDKVYEYTRASIARRSSRVARIRSLMKHFEGRPRWLEILAYVVSNRSDATGLSYIADDIDELIRVYRYKGEV